MLLYIVYIFLPVIESFPHLFAFPILDHLYNTFAERASSNHTDIYRTLGFPSCSTAFQMLHVSKHVSSSDSSMTVAHF